MTEETPIPARRRRPFTLDRVVRLLITIALIIVAVLLIDRLKDVLLPFCVAWLIAYILEPLVQFNKRIFRLKGRFVAIVLTLLETVLIFTILGVIFVPQIVDELHQMSIMVKKYTETAQTSAITQAIHDFLVRTVDMQQLSTHLTEQNIEAVAGKVFNLLSSGLDFILGVFDWFLVILYVIFIMLDYEKLLVGFKRLLPPKYRTMTLSVARDVKEGMNHYFRGQALVSMCVGILFCIGFSIVGLPLGILMGLFIGVLNMVPYLQLISIVPMTILCLVCSVDANIDFWTMWWECILVYCVCQAIQDLLLTPKIMGKAMGLNPAIILLSLSIWGTLLGLIGMIIALPLTTLILSYYNRYVIERQSDTTPQDRADEEQSLKDITGD